MKNILLSGGSRGLGRDLALYLSNKNLVTTFSRGDISETAYKHISGIDAKNINDLDKLYPYLETADVLINNVGIAYDGILATQGQDAIKEILDVNIYSVIYLTKLYLRARLSKKLPGNIISISSIISIRGFSGLAAYSATKGAINSMTKSLAREMGPKGFRVNAVLPGYFESDLSKSLGPEKRKQIVRRTPLGRLATTADICPVVEFLMSDNSSFITGQLVTVDGGLTV